MLWIEIYFSIGRDWEIQKEEKKYVHVKLIIKKLLIILWIDISITIEL